MRISDWSSDVCSSDLLWMEPELHAAAAMPVSSAQAAQSAVDFLQKEAAGASRWFITLPDARTVETKVAWIDPAIKNGQGRPAIKRASLSPATGQRLDEGRETRGGDFRSEEHKSELK